MALLVGAFSEKRLLIFGVGASDSRPPALRKPRLRCGAGIGTRAAMSRAENTMNQQNSSISALNPEAKPEAQPNKPGKNNGKLPKRQPPRRGAVKPERVELGIEPLPKR
jgi:hypothetical protein